MRTSAALAGLVLLLPALVVLTPTAAAGTTRLLTIDTDLAKPSVAFRAFDAQPLKLYDINGDGRMEIIAHNDNKWVYVFDSKTGKLLAELKTKYPSGWGARPLNAIEVGVLNKGEKPSLVVVNSASFVTVFRFEGASASGFEFTKMWERRTNDCYDNPGNDAKPVLADLDKDGDMEILVQTEEIGVFALRHTGEIFWKKCMSGGNGNPGVGDLDGDGDRDVVWVSDGGRISATKGTTGSSKWTYYTGGTKFGLRSASMPVGPAVVQLDGKGGADVIVGAKDNSDCTDFSQNHAALIAVSGEGKLLWIKQDPEGNPLTYTTPIVFNEGGKKAVFWGDWNTQGKSTNCGNYEVTGPAHVYRFDADGNQVWRATLGTWWSNKGLVAADVDGDGKQEILVNAPDGRSDGIWYLDAATGKQEQHVKTYPWKVTRQPVVGDLYGTGKMQWVVPVGANAPEVSGGAIQVYDTGVAYDAAWPRPPDAELGSGSGSGSLPSPGTEPAPTPEPTPPPSGAFAATFRLASGVNNWWVETYVSANHPVAKVEAQIDGTWSNLPATSWGSYAASFKVPTGAKVVFRATNGAGATATSDTYCWLQGTCTGGGSEPTSPPTSGDSGGSTGGTTGTDPYASTTGTSGWYTATFTPTRASSTSRVEVKVEANQPLARVEASINGAAYQRLDDLGGGTWGKDLAAATGAKVVFRAVSTGGGIASSGTYCWMQGVCDATTRTDGGGSTGTFSATFRPRAVGNDWWVEVDVTANAALSGVDARLDGGSWLALSKTSWGTWAKSLKAPDGTKVEFQARSTAGGTAQSGATTWT